MLALTSNQTVETLPTNVDVKQFEPLLTNRKGTILFNTNYLWTLQ